MSRAAKAMQATIMSFSAETGGGTVVTDDGRVVAFDAAAFHAGGLRHLSRGQRVRVTQAASGDVIAVTIYTLPDLLGEGDDADAGSSAPRH